MTKAIEAIIVITLMVFSFFIGVKYSDSVKSHASWLFETKEEEDRRREERQATPEEIAEEMKVPVADRVTPYHMFTYEQ